MKHLSDGLCRYSLVCDIPVMSQALQRLAPTHCLVVKYVYIATTNICNPQKVLYSVVRHAVLLYK